MSRMLIVQSVLFLKNRIFNGLITMETGKCKWCGKEVHVSILIKLGGYCCPACAMAGRQRER